MSDDDEGALVAMRLAAMTRVHPFQSNEHCCSKCGERVGIYPSGQAQLRRDPKLRIICHLCGFEEMAAHPGEAESRPAGSWDEIIQEGRDSVAVGEA